MVADGRREVDRPPPGQIVDVDGQHIHVVDEGVGRPLLLMAAMGSNWFDLDHLAARLVERGWRVIRFDRPGYGLSEQLPRGRVLTLALEVSWMTGVLDALRIAEPVTIVGHSVASLYVEAFARVHPSRTAAVAMLDGSYVLLPWRVVPLGVRIDNAHKMIDTARGVTERFRLPGRGFSRVRTVVLPRPPEGFYDHEHYWAARVFGNWPMLLATMVENAAFPAINASLRRMRKSHPMPRVPVIVVAALSGPKAWQSFWLWKQARYARMLGGRLVPIVSRHFVVLEVPDEIADAIDQLR
ncbi:alpha/beta fold hydrolase [Gordonia sp. 852002-10350_SCH5691597]|uniref:alpha/beta fold hydrolase n=1 Tax=Gordonia sp. 852002-10350_SCH5691597 TaxID=1834085 RepID=UPI0007EBC555|nr:alpha/beta hydrolase [Gordonia sp. 852002-10350_SCH5691597]